MLTFDIETRPGKAWLAWDEIYETAALDLHRNEITVVAYSDGKTGMTSPDPAHLCARIRHERQETITHNGKFDFKTLIAKGCGVTAADYTHDTMLMAVAFTHKIPEMWLTQYNEKRRLLNKELGGTKDVHREAGPHSLKTLAPYFLGVEPFWEVADHNDAEYALTDVRHTEALFHFFEAELRKEGTWDFYEHKLMPWARMLLEAEVRGAAINLPLVDEREKEAQKAAAVHKAKLVELWEEPRLAYVTNKVGALCKTYQEMTTKAVQKLKDPTPERIKKTVDRYNALAKAATDKIEKELNLDSPAQLSWVLNEFYDLNIENFQGDETTGKAVLNRLSAEGRTDVDELLKYRKNNKLCSSFFPSYRDMSYRGRLHASFNLSGAKTGRLSSNGPNLQQVPADLHDLFIAGQGRRLLCYDLSGIEPVIVAYLSEDPFLCDLLIKGGNFHNANVRVMLGIEEEDNVIKTAYKKERDLIKEVGLSILYGAGWRRVQESAQRRGFKFGRYECQEMVVRLKERYEGVFRYKKEVDRALTQGEALTNVCGRQFRIDDPEDVHMKGMNRLVQGSASDLLLESARRASAEFKAQNLDALPILFVHDEIIADTSEKDAQKADAILTKALSSWKLETPYGLLPVVAEGGIHDYWKK